jgi:hypothetical protein
VIFDPLCPQEAPSYREQHAPPDQHPCLGYPLHQSTPHALSSMPAEGRGHLPRLHLAKCLCSSPQTRFSPRGSWVCHTQKLGSTRFKSCRAPTSNSPATDSETRQTTSFPNPKIAQPVSYNLCLTKYVHEVNEGAGSKLCSQAHMFLLACLEQLTPECPSEFRK